MKRARIDKLLVDRGIASSLKNAVSLVISGNVLVDEKPAVKPGDLINPDSEIRIKGKGHAFVGRGGVKLAGALEHFKIDVKDKICIDAGASTGGFTDCLLKAGATKIYAIDVGYGQLSWELRNDSRVVVLERTNIRTIDPKLIPDTIDLIVADLSFISLTLVFESFDKFIAPGAQIIALIKPQFELPKEKIEKGGIVRDDAARGEAVEKVRKAGEARGWKFKGIKESPIKGAKGNVEYLIHFIK
ncbi:MAG: TlyA family RNA methyltransferase [Pseudomonadota bacterium]